MGSCVTSLTFDLGHLDDLNGDVKEALKSSIFVVQKAAAPKSGVEFRQGSIGTIRSSLAASRDVPDFRPIRRREIISHRHTHRHTENRHTGRCCSTSSACK